VKAFFAIFSLAKTIAFVKKNFAAKQKLSKVAFTSSPSRGFLALDVIL
jgi:hypothetical protein